MQKFEKKINKHCKAITKINGKITKTVTEKKTTVAIMRPNSIKHENGTFNNEKITRELPAKTKTYSHQNE